VAIIVHKCNDLSSTNVTIFVHKCNMGIGSRKFVVGLFCLVYHSRVLSLFYRMYLQQKQRLERLIKISAIVINTNKYTMIKEQSGLISI
jgi:hypothetical protein